MGRDADSQDLHTAVWYCQYFPQIYMQTVECECHVSVPCCRAAWQPSPHKQQHLLILPKSHLPATVFSTRITRTLLSASATRLACICPALLGTLVWHVADAQKISLDFHLFTAQTSVDIFTK